MQKSLNNFLSIACKSSIASNKQRPEHNNLVAIIQSKKLKGTHDERSKSLQFVKNQYPNYKPNKNGHGSHWGLLQIWQQWLKTWIGWKLTHLLSTFSLNLRALFCTSTFTSKFLIIFLNAHLAKNKTSPSCILCKLMPQFIPRNIEFIHIRASLMLPLHIPPIPTSKVWWQRSLWSATLASIRKGLKIDVSQAKLNGYL
jgi:hypothetical protein